MRTAHARRFRPRSPLRLTLLATAGSALVGLAMGAATPHDDARPPPAVPMAGAATVLPTDAEVLHVPTPARAPVATPGPAHATTPSPAHATTPSRASRSRAVAGRPAATRKAADRVLWVQPCSAGVVSPYGPRWGGFHDGLDFGCSYGSAIHVVGDGVVLDAGYLPGEGGYGQITLIRHAGGFVTAYAHQSRLLVHAGDRVKAGEVIGLIGSTGHSTGPHLHFEVRTQAHGGKIDPRLWLRAHGVTV